VEYVFCNEWESPWKIVEERIKLQHYNSYNTILNMETAKSVKILRCEDITYTPTQYATSSKAASHYN